MFDRLVDQVGLYPVAAFVVVCSVVLVVAIAVGWALDVFLEHAEREPELPRPVNRAALSAEEREQLMTAHADVVRRNSASRRAAARAWAARR